MFGMGFLEIFLILLVAIIALGPEKLPGAIVDTVKFFKKIKGEITEAKSTIDKELDIAGMKKDAAKLKESLTTIQGTANIDIEELTYAAKKPQQLVENEIHEAEIVAKEPSKKEKISIDKDEKA